MKCGLNFLLVSFLLVLASCAKPEVWELTSKDGNVRFVLENTEVDGVSQLAYKVYFKDTVAIEQSRLGVVMDGIDYGKGVDFLTSTPVKDVMEPYQLKAGKRLNTVNDCREQSFTFQTPKGNEFEVMVRVYADGVAFRYGFPGEGEERHTIQQ